MSIPELGPLVFQRVGDRVKLLGEAPAAAEIERRVLVDADPGLVCVEDELITFTLANGTWQYRIIAMDGRRLIVELVMAS